MTLPPVQSLSPAELRRMFNEGRTRSVIIAYLEPSGLRVAIVDQYVREDGSLGGSGRPDPKRLLHEGTLYVALPV